MGDLAQGPRVGLVGIGLLGQAMAERMLDAGWEVWGYDVRDDLEPFRSVGGIVCESLEELVQQAKRILLCLPDSQISQQAVREMLPFLSQHTIIDTTTGSPDDAVQMCRELEPLGVHYLDVTVAGSSQQMRDHAVTLLVGSSSANYQTSQDLLAVLGAKQFHVGEVGAASRMKLVVNLVIGMNRLVLAEAMAFGESLGFASEQIAEVLLNTPARSAAAEAKAQKMVNQDYAPQARLRQHAKDVKLILELAAQSDAQVPLSNLHATILQRLIDTGFGELDNSVVIEAFRNKD